MATVEKVRKGRLYLGIDVGGTKILASLAEESGAVLYRHASPRPARDPSESWSSSSGSSTRSSSKGASTPPT